MYVEDGELRVVDGDGYAMVHLSTSGPLSRWSADIWALVDPSGKDIFECFFVPSWVVVERLIRWCQDHNRRFVVHTQRGGFGVCYECTGEVDDQEEIGAILIGEAGE
jgi:hypothetical protein